MREIMKIQLIWTARALFQPRVRTEAHHNRRPKRKNSYGREVRRTILMWLKKQHTKIFKAWVIPCQMKVLKRRKNSSRHGQWNSFSAKTQTIMPCSGRYSLISTWLIAEGNKPVCLYIRSVISSNQGGTATKISKWSPFSLKVLQNTTNGSDSSNKENCYYCLNIRSM